MFVGFSSAPLFPMWFQCSQCNTTMATILIVDDRPVNLAFMGALLTYRGHRVIEAADGAEALTMVRAVRPDLVITDVRMPTMDGAEFARRLRASPALSHTPIIFHTASPHDRDTRAVAIAAGVATILGKPCEPQLIIDAVNAALGQPLVSPTADDSSTPTSDKIGALEATGVRLSAMLEFGIELAAERDPGRLLEYACGMARKIIGAEYAAIGILNADRAAIRYFRGCGPDDLPAPGLAPASARQGLLGWLLDERRPCRMRYMPDDTHARTFPAPHPSARSFLGVPIGASDRAYGWLYLINKLDADEFGSEDERLAATLGAQLALAYENIDRYDAISRYTERLEQEIEQRRQAEQEQQALAEQLMHSNRDLEQFAYIVSHDLQEPLRMVAGYTRLLARRYADKLDADAQEFIVFAVDGTIRMQALINDLLVYSRVGAQNRPLAPIDTAAAARQALANLKIAISESRATITCDPLPIVPADEIQLVQLFQNLVANAIKYRSAQPPQITITAARAADGAEWVFAVRDNGIGIDPNYAERVFQIFQRLHTQAEYPGTGIGLAICKRIIERHSGRIWFEPSPGQGTTFYFALPSAGGQK